MAIATLIAAGRLDESLIEEAADRLVDVGISSSRGGWIDEGEAIDLAFEGDVAAARGALGAVEGVDVVIHSGERVHARLFIADMDSTMIGQECIDELADYAGVKPQVAEITERAMRGEIDFAAALAERVALLAGLEEDVIRRCIEERIRPTPGAATLIRTLKSGGVFAQLVTGGFTAFAKPIGRMLGFDAVEANRLEIENGRLTGQTKGPIVDSARKKALLVERQGGLGLSPSETMAAGDGANDIPMIEAAGLGIGYHPKPALAAVADGVIRHHDLTALLWAQGIPRRDWIIC